MLDFLILDVSAEIVGTLVGLAIFAIASMIVDREDVPDEYDLGGN